MEKLFLTFYVPMGHDLDSPDTFDAFEIRRAMEADLEAMGYVIEGAGCGFGGVDFSIEVDADKQDELCDKVSRVVRSYGLRLGSVDVQQADDE